MAQTVVVDGRTIAGAWIRIAPAIGIAAMLILQPFSPIFVVVLALALLSVFLPMLHAGWVGLCFAVVGLAFTEVSMLDTAVAIAGISIIAVSTPLTNILHWQSRVSLTALRPTIRRLTVIVIVSEALALLVPVLAAAGSDSLSWWAPIGAGACVAAVASFMFIVRRTTEGDRGASE